MKKLLFLGLTLLMVAGSFAQLQVQLGTIKTADKNTAINVGIVYIRSLDSIFNSMELFIPGKHSIFSVNPQIDVQTGTSDAFSSITAKLTGMFMTFKTTTLNSNSSVILPDLSRGVQTFPISIGAETNNTFSTVNGIVEAGWVPWYQSQTSKTPSVLKYTKFGIFLQGGYKFKADSAGVKTTGGATDQSAEKLNNMLFRSKGSFSIDTKKLVNVGGINVGVVGSADVWYDFVNKQFYNKFSGIGRFYLATGQFFDLVYSKGSGAPNFNKNDQYGVALTVTF